MGFSLSKSKQKSKQQSTQNASSEQSSSQSANSQSDSTSKSFDLTPEEFEALRGPLADALGGATNFNIEELLGGEATGGAAAFGAENLVAPLAAGEKKQLGNLDNTNPNREGLLNDTLSGKFTDPATNPFLESFTQAQQRTTLQGLQDTLRQNQGLFSSAGQTLTPGDEEGFTGSSAFSRAGATAVGHASTMLRDIAAQIGFQAYDAERGRQQDAIGLSQQDVTTQINKLGAQALPRLIQDQGVQRGLATWEKTVDGVLEALRIAAAVTAPTVGQESAAQSTSESQGESSGSSKSTGQSTGSSKGSSLGVGVDSGLSFDKG